MVINMLRFYLDTSTIIRSSVGETDSIRVGERGRGRYCGVKRVNGRS